MVNINKILINILNIGKQICSKHILLQQTDYTLEMYDTTSIPYSNKIYQEFLTKTKVVFFIYDITNLDSFKDIKNYNQQIDENIPGVGKVLIGFNSEKENRLVTAEEGKKLANELGIDSFFEIPSNEVEKINEMLNIIAAKKMFVEKNNSCLIM